MATSRAKRVREQVVVYLDARDSALLERMAARTKLPKTELFRRGLRRLADDALGEPGPGSSLRYLTATAAEDGFPPDVAGRADQYLYEGGYRKAPRRKRARPR